jgi:hypothetical protein
VSGRTLLLWSGGLGILIGSLSTPLLESPPALHGAVNDRACQICHPGPTRGLRASVHGTLIQQPETAELACTVCHGDLTEHRARDRSGDRQKAPVPAVQAATCLVCHREQDWPPTLGAHPWTRTPPGTEVPRSVLPDQQTGFDWSGLWTVGYRFVNESGSLDRYRTDVNLDSGLRLLEAEVEGRGIGDNWADLFRLQMSGLDDPYTDLRFDLSKDRSYKGLARHTQSEVIFDTSGDYHRVDRNSKRSTFDLSAFPNEDLELFGSYSHLERDSFWLVHRLGDQVLTPLTPANNVASPRRLESDLAELGLSLTSGATAMNLAFDYLDEQSTDQWSYSQPAPINPMFLESEDFTSESTLRGPGARAGLSTRMGDWTLDMTGRFVDLDREVRAAGSATGFSFDEFTRVTTSNSAGGATTWLLDSTLTWEVSDQTAMLLDLRWLDHRETMAIDQLTETTFPNIPITIPVPDVRENRTTQQKLTGSLQVDHSPQRGLDLSLGYGFSREDLTVPDLEAFDSDFISGEIRDNGVLAGVQWRPDEHWTLRGYFEDFRQSGARIHDLAGNDANRLDTSLAYQGPGYRLETFYKLRQADNDVSQYHMDSWALGVNGSLYNDNGLDLFASYVFNDMESRTLTNIFFDPDPTPVPTFVGFTGETHTLTSGLTLRPSARVRWRWDLAYTTTDGSFDVSLLDWRAELGITVWKGGELGLLYRNVDYRDQNQLDNYDADIVLLYWRQIIGAR